MNNLLFVTTLEARGAYFDLMSSLTIHVKIQFARFIYTGHIISALAVRLI